MEKEWTRADVSGRLLEYRANPTDRTKKALVEALEKAPEGAIELLVDCVDVFEAIKSSDPGPAYYKACSILDGL